MIRMKRAGRGDLHHHARKRVVAAACVGLVVQMLLPAPVHADDCRTGAGTSITAGPPVVEGDLMQAAVTISVPSIGDVCNLLVQSLRVWLPDQPAKTPDPCEAPGGTDVSIPGTVQLAPGEFIRIACVDSPIPNCLGAGDVNCELLAAEMCYVADAGDAVAGGLLFAACWTGVVVGDGQQIENGLQTATTLINPQIALSCTPEAPTMCSGQPAFVTFNYLVTTGEGDVSLDEVQLVDNACGPAARGADNPGNNNDILELGEVWTYQCSTTLDIPQVTEAVVTAADVITGHVVSDSAIVELSASCAADLTCDGEVGVQDLAALLSLWGPCPASGVCIEDVWPQSQDGSVGPVELAAILAAWGACTPPV